MSLDVSIMAVRTVEVYTRNITHNLTDMADAVGLYKPIWRPEEMTPSIVFVKDLIPILQKGLDELIVKENELIKLNESNGWGTYPQLVTFVQDYLNACLANPDGTIRVNR